MLGGSLDNKAIHSQLLPETFIPTGAAYAMSVPNFREQDRIFCTPLRLAMMDPIRSIDIDEEIDLLFAEAVAKRYGFDLTP